MLRLKTLLTRNHRIADVMEEVFDQYAGGGEPGPHAVGLFIVDYLEKMGPRPRSEIVQAVKVEWLRVSGRPFNSNVVSKVKKALSDGQLDGRIAPEASKGWWRATNADERDNTLDSDGSSKAEKLAELDELDTNEIEAEHTVGDGEQFVYAYYIPVYKDLYKARGDSRWPMKIGKSIDPRQRLNTHATALPDAPSVAVIVRTNDAGNLERFLHLTLRVRGREYDGTGGSEWFVTNPDEILDIYRFAAGESSDDPS